MKFATLCAALLLLGLTPAQAGQVCTDLFGPNDFLSAGCQVAGKAIASSEYAKVCAPSCIQGLKSYTLALTSACGTDGVAEASRIEAACARVPIPQVVLVDESADCLNFFSPNDFLLGSCRISGNRVTAGDFAQVCSAQCLQNLNGYTLALRSACGTAGDAEAKRIEAGCQASKVVSFMVNAQSSKCTDGFGPNDFLNAKCQVQDGSIDSAAEFQKVCSESCRFDLSSYLNALRAACASEGDAEARRIESGCKGASVFTNMASFGKSCVSFYNASDFLRPECQIGDARVVSSSDFATVCAPSCRQDLRSYLSALRATCAVEGDLEASRVEKGCHF